MDLRHLRYFLCVAEEMHFGRAASRLGMSQPPLSQQIRALEDELGARLFERTSRRVQLTKVGEAFLPEAQRTLQQADRAAQTARLAARGELGRLSLGFTTSGPFVPRVANALFRFREQHPRVELVLQELSRDDQIARVQHGDLDLGIVRAFDDLVLPPGMTEHFLLEEDFLLALRADHPLAAETSAAQLTDLVDEPVVLYEATLGAGFNAQFIAMCEEAGFTPNITYEAGSLATLLGLVAAGFGATVVSRSLARLHLENLIYRPLATPVKSRLWIIRNEDPSPTAAKFIAALLEQE